MYVARVSGDWRLGDEMQQWCDFHVGRATCCVMDGWFGDGWWLEWHGDYWQVEMDDEKLLTMFLLRWA